MKASFAVGITVLLVLGVLKSNQAEGQERNGQCYLGQCDEKPRCFFGEENCEQSSDDSRRPLPRLRPTEPPPNELPPNRCDLVQGDWAWDLRAFPATIYQNGSVSGNDGGRQISARWSCLDSVNGKILVRWSTGYVDELTLSGDTDFLTGVNNAGTRLVVRRR